MSLQALSRSLWRISTSHQRLQTLECSLQQHSLSRGHMYSSMGPSGGGVGGKKPEQLSEEELRAALPSMLFTTSNLIWSTTLAVGVAAAGLLCMFQVGAWITDAAKSLRHLEQPVPAVAPPPTKSLAELIADRKAELQQQLTELQQLPRTSEVKHAIAATKQELRQFRSPGPSWLFWR